MAGYYEEKLSAERLRQVYETAPPRIRQYLAAEIDFVLSHIDGGDMVLELGCGYGRVLDCMAEKAALAVGVDTSPASLALCDRGRRPVILADAVELPLGDNSLDLIACVQNGISAFAVDQGRLVRESIRVIRPRGKALFSSYSDKFWKHRLEWFELQAGQGLLGEIDYEATGNGVIVCKDGFRATTVGPDRFRRLASKAGARCHIKEVDNSSLFCIFEKE